MSGVRRTQLGRLHHSGTSNRKSANHPGRAAGVKVNKEGLKHTRAGDQGGKFPPDRPRCSDAAGAKRAPHQPLLVRRAPGSEGRLSTGGRIQRRFASFLHLLLRPWRRGHVLLNCSCLPLRQDEFDFLQPVSLTDPL